MYHDAGALIWTLRSAGCFIGNGAEEVMERKNFVLSRELGEVDLVKKTTQEHGFERSVHYGDVFARGFELGLQPGPMELAALLRLHYQDQPEGELLRVVVTEGITNMSGRRSMFAVMNHGGRLLLDICSGTFDLNVKHDDIFLWIRPRRMRQ